mgnify:CR=1 FL=1
MRKVSLVMIFFILISLNTQAQFISGQKGKILLKGKVLEEDSNQPAGVNMKFINKKGKEFRANSNSESGIYKVLLESGKEYEVKIHGDNILRKTTTLKIDKKDDYVEMDRDFTVQKLKPGLVLANINNAYEGDNLNEKAISALKKIKIMMRFNRNMQIKIYLIADKSDSQKAKYRLSAIEDLIGSWKVAKRNVKDISIKPEYQNIKPKGNAEDIVVFISKISDPFSE